MSAVLEHGERSLYLKLLKTFDDHDYDPDAPRIVREAVRAIIAIGERYLFVLRPWGKFYTLLYLARYCVPICQYAVQVQQWLLLGLL